MNHMVTKWDDSLITITSAVFLVSEPTYMKSDKCTVYSVIRMYSITNQLIIT